MFEVYITQNARLYLKALNQMYEERRKKNMGEEVEKTPSDWSLMNEDQKRILRYALISFFYFLWLVIGVMFSKQWLIFLGIIVFGFCSGYYRRRMFRHRTRAAVNWIKFDATVSALAIAFIIINHFHNIL